MELLCRLLAGVSMGKTIVVLHLPLQVAGMLIYYILTGGEHPYGASSFDIEVNIARGSPKLRRLTPEADDLLRSVLTTTPKSRPTVDELLRSRSLLAHLTHSVAEEQWRKKNTSFNEVLSAERHKNLTYWRMLSCCCTCRSSSVS